MAASVNLVRDITTSLYKINLDSEIENKRLESIRTLFNSVRKYDKPRLISNIFHRYIMKEDRFLLNFKSFYDDVYITKHTNSKKAKILKLEDKDIYDLYFDNYSMREISRKRSISQATVSRRRKEFIDIIIKYLIKYHAEEIFMIIDTFVSHIDLRDLISKYAPQQGRVISDNDSNDINNENIIEEEENMLNEEYNEYTDELDDEEDDIKMVYDESDINQFVAVKNDEESVENSTDIDILKAQRILKTGKLYKKYSKLHKIYKSTVKPKSINKRIKKIDKLIDDIVSLKHDISEIDRILPNKKFKVTIEELLSQEFEIEAPSEDELYDTVEKLYRNGKLILDNPSLIHTGVQLSEDSQFVDIPIKL